MSQEIDRAAAAFARLVATIHIQGNRLATDVQPASNSHTLENVGRQVVEVEQHIQALRESFMALRRQILAEVQPNLAGRSLVQRVLIGVWLKTRSNAGQKTTVDVAA